MDEGDAVSALSLLNDDVRRRLYRVVRRSPQPVTREEAAQAISISPKLAAFHLDRLVDVGLLLADHQIPAGSRRRVGRAPKRYRPSQSEVSMSVPARHYDLVGEILLDAIAETRAGVGPQESAFHVAYERGQEMGRERQAEIRRGRLGAERTIGEARALLERMGYEPADDSNGIALRNCPFHALAQRSPEVVCGLNVSFIDGLLRGLGNTNVKAELAPQPGLCCVRVRPPSS